MTHHTTTRAALKPSLPLSGQPIQNSELPADAAHSYICEMLAELTQIAEGANLKDLAGLLSLTVAAASLSKK